MGDHHMTFIPFDADDDEVAERRVLRPGVPNTMRPDLTNWIWSQLRDENYARANTFHDIENNLDVSFAMNPEFHGLINEREGRRLLGRLEPRDLMRLVDYLLFKKGKFVRNIQTLTGVLSAGRSQYFPREADGEGYRLASRVPEGVQHTAEQLMASETSAGRLLQRAWNKAFDLAPDPSGAYSAAVKSVESAAFKALSIDKDLATLSDAVRAIEKKEANWRLPFKREHSEYPSKQVLVALLKSLYRGQRDRHGRDAYEDVTQDEAEAAVLLAVTLVGWFEGGHIRERDSESFA